jgi:hypothetical protein
MHQEQDSQLTCSVLGQRLFDGYEVLQRFGHFAALNMQMATVKEEVDPVVVFERSL